MPETPMSETPAPGARSSWGAHEHFPTYASDGEAMTETPGLSGRAARHLWMHFSRMGSYEDHEVPVIVRGEGAYVWDQHGKRYLDGLAGLFTSQLGHGRTELAEAGAKQAETLAYFPLWTYAHPRAIELAERIAGYAPGDLNRVFFTTGGSEAVESAWKLARQYFRMQGQPQRTKVISRYIAYHGTSMGALSITGIPDLRTPFEPLVPGTIKVPNTNFYRAEMFADDAVAFGRWAADEIDRAIEREGPDTVAAVFLEPVQNAGGCFPPPPGYFERVREICDRHGVLLVSDEVICAFGRLGHWFGALRYGYQPDIITVAKGLTSGYSPLGAMIASDRLMEPFLGPGKSFLHGFTFAGHPVSCAVAMANLDVFEGERILQHVQSTEADFRAALESLRDLPIVGDVRGDGFFYGIELVKDKETRLSFDDDESERLLRGYLSGALFEAGLICRADDRGDPVVQLSPPLICEQEEFDFMASTLREVLSEAWRRM
jgi:adenosylmethionine-8-amino-7-oxononanoate aminotransferase